MLKKYTAKVTNFNRIGLPCTGGQPEEEEFGSLVELARV